MNISIFGLGYVGCVSLGCLAQNGHNVIGVDVNKTKIEQINSGKATIIEKDINEIVKKQFNKGNIRATSDYNDAVQNSEISIVCVGTPSSTNGHLELRFIFNVANQIGEVLREKKDFHIIAIRSTVLPGTADKFAQRIEKVSNKKRNIDFAVLSNPEFLREGTAVFDYYNPSITLIGTDNSKAAEKLAMLYHQLPAEIIITELKIAEIMKYVNNTFHALKISFGNEIGNICKELSIDSHKVMEIFVKDKQLNISSYYFKPGFAYGGSCLPKDLRALQTLAHDNYLQCPIIQSIDKTNALQIKKAIDLIIAHNKKNIGFLGFSFKAGTDDLRNSPSLKVIETLIGKGYEVKIYDKNVHISVLTGTNKKYIDSHIPHLSNLIVENIDELINNSEVIVVTTKEEEFSEKLINIHNKHIIDFVRIDERLLKKENYSGICW